ncbi:MAG: 2-succinyl-5-enolpyruvyl-6-hydroxy-3-cyclohexene-1-carboxylic-acid synthase [Clostridiales bacterium]|jgi:2-succinyl-5-enolpyruvyl-6-hydroxy-3-cyclohexene-1-carboxylate synthase|nr:2-succinyl-5-enolpyruvyl-6-hydroxy-3-cyclohexene-1-carboxylic-acid synthase [Clostridiales bacterium]
MYSEIENVQILIALLKKYKVKKMVLSPGARNSPIVHSLERDDFFECYSIVDERSAGFFAMGLAQESHDCYVGICCTSGTASVNYSAAVNEACYQSIPLVVITADKTPYTLFQLEEQQIPQSSIFNQVCKKEVTLPIVQDSRDAWYCERIINEALMELNHNGRGPVHINIPVDSAGKHPFISFNADTLPEVKKIEQLVLHKLDRTMQEQLQKHLYKKRVLLIYGQNHNVDDKERQLIEEFCKKYNCVVSVENIANVHCSKAINLYLLSEVISDSQFTQIAPDIVISMNGQYMSKLRLRLKNYSGYMEHWCVNEEGRIIDHLQKLTHVIEGDNREFFEFFNENVFDSRSEDSKENAGYYNLIKAKIASIEHLINQELPFSNNYIIQQMMKKIPGNTILHLGIDSIVRFSQSYSINPITTVYSNRGTTGIDGGLSSFIGQAVADKDRLAFLIIGDLSFFYDMNGLWNRYVGSNVRIILCNNAGGETFYWNPARIIETKDNFIAAEHFTKAKGWVKSLNIRYLSVKNKEEFDRQMPLLFEASDKPIFMEVFTDKAMDAKILMDFYSTLRKAVQNLKGIVIPGNNYVVYGAGNNAELMTELIEAEQGNVLCYCDSDINKWGTMYRGKDVMSPEQLKERRQEFSKIAISSSKYYKEISQALELLGFTNNEYFGI